MPNDYFDWSEYDQLDTDKLDQEFDDLAYEQSLLRQEMRQLESMQ